MNLISDLEWRYACKKMNNKPVDQEKIDRILKAISLTPTSMGIEAYKVFVITDKVLIKRIFDEAAPRQLMLPGCSHLLVFASFATLTLADVDKYLTSICKIRDTTMEHLAAYRQLFIDNILTMADEVKAEWMARQTYIAMGFALAAAANERVDSTPVEGFDPQQLDRILGLGNKGLRSVLVMPLGFRDVDDHHATAKKIRKSDDDLFIHI